MSWISQLQMPGHSHRGPLPPSGQDLTEISRTLRRHLVHLSVTIGPRSLQRPATLARAADYIEGEFRRLGLEPRRQSYSVDLEPCHNLEVRLPGPGPELVIGAHYDSVPNSPAANDNGTGVAAVLLLAEKLRGLSLPRGVRLVAFVNEEPPYFQTPLMGSWVYAKELRAQDIELEGMICLETIGYYTQEPNSQHLPEPLGQLYPKTGNFITFAANLESRALLHKAIGTFRSREAFPSEGLIAPDEFPFLNWSDHFGFWEEGYPAIMITDTAPLRYPFYHTSEDTLDKLNFDGLSRVCRGLVSTVSGWPE